MKPFNKNEALAGKPVVTRSGQSVVLLHEYPVAGLVYPLAGLIVGNLELSTWTPEGKLYLFEASPKDLFMASTLKKGFIAIGKKSEYRQSGPVAYSTHVYETAEEALKVYGNLNSNVAIAVPVSWAE